MNKSEMVTEMYQKLHETMTQKQCEDALAAFLKITENALIQGEQVNLWQFGTFEVRSYGERAALSPRTQTPITITARKRIAFKPSKHLKQAIN